jgi:hypothetical protein
MSENFPHQIVVPADVVARSRPTGHSVPIIRPHRKLKRSPPIRKLIIVSAVTSLVALAVLFSLSMRIYSSYEPLRAAGYHLVCQELVTGGSGLQRVCHWDK